jgi:hypothetical protein
VIPGCRFQHWDIALSRNGPVVLEMNFDGDLDLYQHASHRGVCDGLLRAAVAQFSRRHASFVAS